MEILNVSQDNPTPIQNQLYYQHALHHAYIFPHLVALFVELSLRQSYYPYFGTKDCSSFIASPRKAITLLIPK
jgi:hypothetical protein